MERGGYWRKIELLLGELILEILIVLFYDSFK